MGSTAKMNSTDSHPKSAWLTAFALGQLSDAESAPLEEHIANCESCQRVLEAAPADDLMARVQAVGAALADAPVSPPAPSGYEILEEVGRGGMGVVYKARQRPLNRIVALKMLRSGLPIYAEDRVRFGREAEAVAKLRHPNIVQIFEVGERQGQPYLALEFIDGGTLAERLSGRPLAPTEAAHLIETLARSIDYAHSQGVVHRDLKPSNVLLSGSRESGIGNRVENTGSLARTPTSDSRFPFPQITDFGLAKQIDDAEGPTRTGVVLGTPSYMAPEQVANAADAGTSADIYALGAILYECLTGRPPFRAATALETLEQVRSNEPVAVRAIQPHTPRDLETICLKCLRKEPKQRYASALALAEDLQRFAAGHSILARPTPAWERAYKWARRRPAHAALLIVGFVTPLAALTAVMIHNAKLRAEADRADRAQRRADDHYRQARAALRQVLGHGAPAATSPNTRITEVRLRQLEDALHFYNAAVKNDAEDPEARYDLATAHLAAAAELTAQSRRERALPHLQAGQAIMEKLSQEFPDNDEYASLLGACYNNLGFYHNSFEQFELAEKYHRSSLTMRERVASRDAQNLRACRPLAESYLNLGTVCQCVGRLHAAERYYERAAELWLQIHHKNADVHTALNLADCRINLGQLTLRADRIDEANQYYAEIDRLLRPLLDHPTIGVACATSLAGANSNWANLLRAAGRNKEMFDHFGQAEQLLQLVALREPTWHNADNMRYSLHGARAQALDALGRHQEALRDWDAAVAAATSDPQRNWVRLTRLFTRIKLGDYMTAASEAAALTDQPKLDGLTQYNLACAFGRCMASAAEDQALAAEQRTAQLADFRRHALACLQACHAVGFFTVKANLENLLVDADLAPLKPHPEFRQLIAELQKAK